MDSSVLFLSLPGVIRAIRYHETPLIGLGELFFLDRPHDALHEQDVELEAVARGTTLLPMVLSTIETADKNGCVSWARKEGSAALPRSWSQLNDFLSRHGLGEVEEEGRYTEHEAAHRVSEANPDLAVFA